MDLALNNLQRLICHKTQQIKPFFLSLSLSCFNFLGCYHFSFIDLFSFWLILLPVIFQLHIAAANGYLKVGKFLLDNKVPVNIRDDDSWEPIHAAACWQQVNITFFLYYHTA